MTDEEAFAMLDTQVKDVTDNEGQALDFDPLDRGWRVGVEDGLHMVEPAAKGSHMYTSGYYIGYSIALDRLRGGFDEI